SEELPARRPCLARALSQHCSGNLRSVYGRARPGVPRTLSAAVLKVRPRNQNADSSSAATIAGLSPYRRARIARDHRRGRTRAAQLAPADAQSVPILRQLRLKYIGVRSIGGIEHATAVVDCRVHFYLQRKIDAVPAHYGDALAFRIDAT